MPFRSALESIPSHLEQFIVKHDAIEYTPIDHASWRYIMRISKRFFSKTAHPSYLDGLEKTGISIDRIPSITEMDKKLREFGWRAVPVSGFIPPSAFMEFQSLGVLPIACDMRRLENLAYTPAPDIVHEAAGHAPIISDPSYSNYLRRYGEISRKAIANKEDLDTYRAIRNLSEVKENPQSTLADTTKAQAALDEATSRAKKPSEAALMARMNWWTVEYGLVGEQSSPKIYGAGLLSSVTESFHCLTDEVKKIPFSIECVETTYDITRPQPQLYIAKNFDELCAALEELSLTLSFRKGGVFGLERAVTSQLVNTVTLNSGIQISGVLRTYEADSAQNATYLSFQGPTQLSYHDQEIPDQGPKHHHEGFGSPLGLINGRCPSLLTESDLEQLGFSSTTSGKLLFDNGVLVAGSLLSTTYRDGKLIILSLKDCTVTHQNRILFNPTWGIYDMACGSIVESVFGGAADRGNYLKATESEQKLRPAPKSNLTSENKRLNALYAQVRKQREKATSGHLPTDALVLLEETYRELKNKFPSDWLLRLELLELLKISHQSPSWKADLKKDIDELRIKSKTLDELITRGLQLA